MIPKKIHFSYGLESDFGGVPFLFVHWASILSASKLNPDYEIHFWYEFEPNTRYFAEIKNRLILHNVQAPKNVNGVEIHDVKYRFDILKILVLLEHGGIFLDLDTLTVKSFDVFLQNKTVLPAIVSEDKIVSLCNSILLSEADSQFLRLWVDYYNSSSGLVSPSFFEDFRSTVPLDLALRNPSEVTLFSSLLFCTPDNSTLGINQLFNDVEYNNGEAYCYHLWQSQTAKTLSLIREFNYYHFAGIFGREIDRIVGEEAISLANIQV